MEDNDFDDLDFTDDSRDFLEMIGLTSDEAEEISLECFY